MKQFYEQYKTPLRILAALFVLLFIFRGTFILVVLIALSLSMSYIVNRFGWRKFGIELVTFIAVLSGMKYPWWIAMMLTFVLITYHLVAGGFYGPYIMWVIPAYCVGALVSSVLPQSMGIFQMGMLVTLGINANNIFFTAITSPGFLANYMIYVVTNILFNLVIFSVLSPLAAVV